MSRGVSHASGSVWVHYFRPAREGETDSDCGRQVEEWEDIMASLKCIFKRAFPSLRDADKWLGREDRAILENSHAYIGVSEYNGIVAVWCVPKDDGCGIDGMSAHWCGSIEDKAGKIIAKSFDALISQSHFSNGEQIFSRVDKPTATITSKEGQLACFA